MSTIAAWRSWNDRGRAPVSTVTGTATDAALQTLRFVRSQQLDAAPPPSMVRGPLAWVRQNLFSGPLNIVLTLIGLYLVYALLPGIVRFFLVDAVWTGADRDACRPEVVGRPVGACWAYVFDKINYFVYGSTRFLCAGASTAFSRSSPAASAGCCRP